MVGASGAIAAIMGAYAVWYPNAPVRTLILCFLGDISAKWFLGIVVKESGFGQRKLNRSDDPMLWDYTGGAGHGPYPHPFERQRGLIDDF